MAVNRTPKGRKAAAEPEYTGYFEAMERGSSEKDTGDDGGSDLAKQVAELNARVEALASSNEDLQRANMVLTQHQPREFVPYVASGAEDEDKLPDPVMDADGFTRGLLSRVEQLVASDLAATRDQQNLVNEEAAAFQGLWEDFASDPAMAPWVSDPDKVEFATVKVGKRMQSRGVDINRYMFQYRDQFFADVAAELKNQFGDAGDTGTQEDDEADEGADRTEGIFGGQQAPVTRPAAKDPDKNAPDLLSDLSEIQRRTGYY